ncbi:MAG: hypothetical protein EBS07_09995 [Sphingobacteriia bacterium]|nr:hypothetical protein [Sphingobacteriia bacterium]
MFWRKKPAFLAHSPKVPRSLQVGLRICHFSGKNLSTFPYSLSLVLSKIPASRTSQQRSF